MSDQSYVCFSCLKASQIPSSGVVSKREECPSCGSDVRVCLNCEFYDKTKYNECREPISEAIREKSKANSCESFKLKKSSERPAEDSRSKLLSQAEALFKKKS